MKPATRESQETDLIAVASALLGRKVDEIARAGGGGNSRIYRVSAAGESYALKMYPVIAGDARDRLGVEKKALQFFEAHNVACVPRWIGDGQGYALLSWVEGNLANPPTNSEIEQAIAFIADIKRLSQKPGADALPAASEACESGAEVVRQIENRLTRLQEAMRLDPTLARFISERFLPAFTSAVSRAQRIYSAAGLDFDAPLANHRCLIPADFGFHNAMRAPGGTLTFIDFEYFGWDDPTKLVADFLLHPAMTLPQAQREQFRSQMLALFADDATFATRLTSLTPLFALRWVLILLNEFLPERWRGRAFAKGESEWEAAKGRQLAKASNLLNAITEGTL